MSYNHAAYAMVCKALTEGRHDLLYIMIPADDGGQSYEMKCQVCGEAGNNLAGKFAHAPDCPVDGEEKKSTR